MAFRNLFGRSGGMDDELEVEDLLVLGRLDEADRRLRAALTANPRDLRARQRLVDLRVRQGRGEEAVATLLDLADTFAADGFHDRALAVLSQVHRLRPGDPGLARRIAGIERTKRVERLRQTALAVLERRWAGGPPSPPERQCLGQGLGASPLLARLDEDQTRRLFAACSVVRAAEGQVVASEGSGERRLLLIADGQLDAEVALAGGEYGTRLRSYGAGDVVGDSVLLQRWEWPASYRAASRCLLVLLDAAGLEAALLGNPDPRRMLDALRCQGHDAALRMSVRELGGGRPHGG